MDNNSNSKKLSPKVGHKENHRGLALSRVPFFYTSIGHSSHTQESGCIKASPGPRAETSVYIVKICCNTN